MNYKGDNLHVMSSVTFQLQAQPQISKMVGYAFVSLSQPQIELRRKQLDQAGFLAWLSPVVLLTFIFLVRCSSSYSGSSARRGKSSQQILESLRRQVRRLKWRLEETYVLEFGPANVQVIGICYASWLVYLSFRNTGNDYMHMTKALGHVAVSQLPFQYLLSIKSAFSPVAFATGLTHERLNAYHRFFGRIVHSMLAAHAVLYLNFFIQIGALQKRIKDMDVRLGIAAFWAFNVLGLAALPAVRRRFYHAVFYRSHVLLSAAIVSILYFHVVYTRRYILQAGVFWLVGGLLRTASSVPIEIFSTSIPNSNMLHVTAIAKEESGKAIGEWVPGQHVYLCRDGFGPRNPFTVLSRSTRHGKQCVELGVRCLSGQTKWLASNTGPRKGLSNMSLEGPYGESIQYLQSVVRKSQDGAKVLLVAGGVGSTYTIPIYATLLRANSGRSEGIHFVWFVKSLQEAKWGVDIMVQQLGELKVTDERFQVDIYITGDELSGQNGGTPFKGTVPGVNMTPLKPEERAGRDDFINSIVERTFRHGQARSEDSNQPHSGSRKSGRVITARKRPLDPRKHGEDTSQELNTHHFIVLSCGPPGLSQQLRRAVSPYVLRDGASVVWHEEVFGFGG